MSTDPKRTDHLREQRSSPEDEGLPDILDGDPEQKRSIGVQEEGIMPPGPRPRGATAWGTTAAEQVQGEPQADRLRREAVEEPEEHTADRLTSEAAGDGQAVAEESGDAAGLSAEEEAVRETREPETR